MYNERQKNYSIEYAKEKLKRVPFDIPKEYYENTLKPAAAAAGLSVNGFIKQAIAEKIEREKNNAV